MITFSNLGKYGRLGNQLFQIASVIGIAHANRHNYVFPKWKYSSFMKKSLPLGNMKATKVNEAGFHYGEIRLGPGNYDIVGYLQSWRYFDRVRDQATSHFKLADSHMKEVDRVISSLDNATCSLHVRRTDYLNLKDHHPVLPVAYYTRAMEVIGDCTFVVFSDDIAWCKQNFVGKQFVFIENSWPDIYDLVLMSKCKHNVIANSSFSWWGAYLNENPNKKVIAPAKWFGPAYHSLDTKDLLPESWSKI